MQLISLCDHTPRRGQYRDFELQKANYAKNKGISLEQAAEQLNAKIAERKATTGDLNATLKGHRAILRAGQCRLASHDDDTVEKVVLMQGLGANISEFPVTIEAAQEARTRSCSMPWARPTHCAACRIRGTWSARETHAEELLDRMAADNHPRPCRPC